MKAPLTAHKGRETVSNDSLPLPGDILAIASVGRKKRRVKTWEGLSLLAGAAALMLVARCLLDWWLDFPRAMRALLLCVDVAIAGYFIWRFPFRAWRNRISLEGSALMVEKHWPALKTALISAIQLSRAHRHERGSAALVTVLIERARRQVHGLKLGEVVPTRRLRALAAGAISALLLAGGAAIAAGSAAPVLLQRYFAAAVPLPTSTVVRPVTRELSATVGSNVTMTARAEGVIPRSGRVQIVAAEGETQEYSVSGDPADPALFTLTMENIQKDFTYRFLLNDGRGEAYQVKAVVGPVIEDIQLHVVPPAYSGLPAEDRTPEDLSVLPGTIIRIRVTASHPLKRATFQPHGGLAPAEMTIDPADSRRAAYEFQVVPSDMTGFRIPLTNQQGVMSANDVLYRMQILADHPPQVRLVRPVSPPPTTTLSAELELVYEAADDFRLEATELYIEVSKTGSEESSLRRRPLPATDLISGVSPVVRWRLEREEPPLHVGDKVTFWIEARDNNNVTGPGIGKSESHSFAIVTPKEKEAELLDRLYEQAEEIQRLQQMQRDVIDDIGGIIRKTEPQKP